MSETSRRAGYLLGETKAVTPGTVNGNETASDTQNCFLMKITALMVGSVKSLFHNLSICSCVVLHIVYNEVTCDGVRLSTAILHCLIGILVIIEEILHNSLFLLRLKIFKFYVMCKILH